MNSDIVFSASTLKTYKQCGRKFYLYKVTKSQPSHEPYHYGWVGTIVHNTIYYSFADYIDNKWTVKGPKPYAQVMKFFEDIWEGQIKLEVSKNLVDDSEISDEKPIFREGSMKDKKFAKVSDDPETQWKALAKSLVETGYHLVTSTIWNHYSDIQLEVQLKFPYEGLMDIVGYVDILAKNDADGRWHFFDLKTSRSPIKFLNTDIQFYLYRYGLKSVLDLNYFPIGHYVHLRSKKVHRAESTKKEVFDYVDYEIRDLLKNIEKEHWEPNLYSPLCKFCEFRGYCYSANGEFITGQDLDKIRVLEDMNDFTSSQKLEIMDYDED